MKKPKKLKRPKRPKKGTPKQILKWIDRCKAVETENKKRLAEYDKARKALDKL
ncbi:hypothetical protein [Leptospira interrogans]|uniref:hypothetical protein n=1 Tax=Leptospira interrogans TaxID=173 RepID=UPI000297A72D|nr:hypothetical protein [Leptospira interrogans]EKR17329.1 hypothetical protein LEP1GSC019_0089 [Leptospira interrogans serovar Pyrogenes str. 2006006960]